MMIHSAAREEEIEKSLDAPCRVEGLLGQPSGKFDYKVFYSKLSSYDIPIESIVPGGWGDEFKDDKPKSKKRRVETPKQPHRGVEDLLGLHLSKSNDKKQLDKKKVCTVGVWKDEVIETDTEKMQE